MKIYSGGGDGGMTSLLSGERVAKNAARVEAYGVVDELNALAGMVRTALPSVSGASKADAQLVRIQRDLFSLGAWLATQPGSPASARLAPWTEAPGKRLEDEIDDLQSGLEELRSFLLPGGHPAASWSHVARTVCRRAERRIVDLVDNTSVDENLRNIAVYINRLSDYFFVLARYCNHITGTEESLWQG